MKKFILIGLISLFTINLSGQGRNISLVKKSKTPVITSNNDTIKVGTEIMVLEGSNEDGSFKYVQSLNFTNEPVKPASSRDAFRKQKVKFFKEQHGTSYLFTKFYVINIEAALHREEIRLIKPSVK